MKKKRKVLIISFCEILLAVASIIGTVAFLTSRDTVVNTFTVGQVDIVLDETKVTPDGKPIDGADRVKENNYHMIPGQTYVKDPRMLIVEKSEESYVRMLVTINCYEALQEIYDGAFLPQNFVDGWDNEIWTTTGAVKVDGDEATYEFRYYKTVGAVDEDENVILEPLFESFTVPDDFNGEQLASIADLQITVVGHAIQTIGFDNADEAWTAFDEQMNAD